MSSTESRLQRAKHGPLAQETERQASNLRVEGAIPSWASISQVLTHLLSVAVRATTFKRNGDGKPRRGL